MSALAIVALIAGVGVVGYIGYDIYKAATAPTGLQKIVGDVSGDVKKGVTDVVNGEVGVDHYLAEGFNDAFGWI